jgi:hypothetical protein
MHIVSCKTCADAWTTPIQVAIDHSIGFTERSLVTGTISLTALGGSPGAAPGEADVAAAPAAAAGAGGGTGASTTGL